MVGMRGTSDETTRLVLCPETDEEREFLGSVDLLEATMQREEDGRLLGVAFASREWPEDV